MKNKGNLKKRLIIYAVIAVALVLFSSWQNSMLTVTEYSYKSDKIGNISEGD